MVFHLFGLKPAPVGKGRNGQVLFAGSLPVSPAPAGACPAAMAMGLDGPGHVCASPTRRGVKRKWRQQRARGDLWSVGERLCEGVFLWPSRWTDKIEQLPSLTNLKSASSKPQLPHHFILGVVPTKQTFKSPWYSGHIFWTQKQDTRSDSMFSFPSGFSKAGLRISVPVLISISYMTLGKNLSERL